MSKFTRKIVSLITVFVLILTISVLPVSAAENPAPIRISDYLSDDDIIFMEKMALVYDVFAFDEAGNLILTADLNQIQDQAGFTDAELILFQQTVSNANINNDTINIPGSNSRMHVSDWKVYFTYDEVMSLFFAAATVGPAALTAAISALSTSVGGLAGTILGAIIGFVVSADMCYLVIRAASTYKGIYIGFTNVDGFPVFDQGTW